MLLTTRFGAAWLRQQPTTTPLTAARHMWLIIAVMRTAVTVTVIMSLTAGKVVTGIIITAIQTTAATATVAVMAVTLTVAAATVRVTTHITTAHPTGLTALAAALLGTAGWTSPGQGVAMHRGQAGPLCAGRMRRMCLTSCKGGRA
jgi:hypothetical protein